MSPSISHNSAYNRELLASCIAGLPSFDSESPYSTTLDEPAVKYIQPPNPGWAWGDGVESTELGRKWMERANKGSKYLDPESKDLKTAYNLLMGGIQPRPIAFVSSVAADGAENLAPFSFFQIVNPGPPSSIMIVSRNTPRVKDTAANILATKGFTVNIVSLPWIEQANIASIDTPESISEWDLSGLTKEPSTHVCAPRVKESAFSLECTFWHKFDLEEDLDAPTGAPVGYVIFGRIKCLHVWNDCLNSRGAPDPAKLMAVSRMGDITYGLTTHAFRLPRPDWEADGAEIERVLKEKKLEKESKAKDDEGSIDLAKTRIVQAGHQEFLI